LAQRDNEQPGILSTADVGIMWCQMGLFSLTPVQQCSFHCNHLSA